MQILIFFMGLLFVFDAQAYLDPGTGSMLLQVLLGGVAAVAVAVKLYWYRILRIFGIRKDDDTIVEDSGGPDT
jgi:hypothetical protein